MNWTRPRIAGAVAGLGLLAALVPALPGTSSAADGDASVTIVHGIPSVGNVDVCVGDTTPLLPDVPFKGVATVTVPGGTYDLSVKLAAATPCTGTTAISAPGTVVPAGANVSVVANLVGGSPNLGVYANEVGPVAAGQGRVAVYHAADAPAVDILVDGSPALTDLAPATVQSADVPTGSYDVVVTPAGDDGTTVLSLPGVEVPAGKLLEVYAVGAVPDPDQQNPFQVITNLVDLTTESTTTVPAPTVPAPTSSTVPPAAPAQATPAMPAMTG